MRIAAMAVLLVFSVGCVAPQIYALEGREVGWQTGKGGVVRTIEGIDFWTFGAPNQSFKTVGIIVHGSRGDVDVAKAVRAAGAHGVVMVADDKAADALVAGEEIAPQISGARYVVIAYEKPRAPVRVAVPSAARDLRR